MRRGTSRDYYYLPGIDDASETTLWVNEADDLVTTTNEESVEAQPRGVPDRLQRAALLFAGGVIACPEYEDAASQTSTGLAACLWDWKVAPLASPQEESWGRKQSARQLNHVAGAPFYRF